MRKLAFLAVLGILGFIVAAGPALAFSVKISGTHTADEIRTTCDKNGGSFSMDEGTGAYECDGPKGTVFCDKGGSCEGRCSRCGGVVSHTTFGGILRGVVPSQVQPLQPDAATTPADDAAGSLAHAGDRPVVAFTAGD